jgi:CheY-like chemotaxis protein
MNIGPNNPSGSAGGKGRRRRGRRGAPGRPGHSGPGHHNSRNNQQNQVFTRPMDHSYRNGNQDFSGGRSRGRGPATPAPYVHQEIEPVVHKDESAAPKIFAFVDDLFFLAKIQEVARKLNVKVEFVKTDKDILDRVKNNGDEKPSLIIIDLNNLNAKPLTIIPKLKKELKKGTAIIGFVSHVQGELKMKAQEAGCDMVLPRSAFSQNLPSLLRRHGTASEAE